MGKRLDNLKLNQKKRKKTKLIVFSVILFFLCVLFIFYQNNLKNSISKQTTAKTNEAIIKKEENPPPKNHSDETSKPDAAISVPKELTVIAVGDVLLDRQVGEMIKKYGIDEPFSDVTKILTSADVTIANLECALSTRGTKADKEYTFRGHPSWAIGIKNAGIDAVSLANNHSLDFGTEALRDTINILDEYGIYHAGAGMNSSKALLPAMMEINEKKASFLAFSYIIPNGFLPSSTRAGIAHARSPYALVTNGIKDAKENSDFVIVSFHWGVEYEDYPIKSQIELAHLAIDAGADLVVAHHPHVIQGIEIYKDKLIAYSLGDFVFDHYSRKTGEAFILKCKISQEKTLEARAIPVYLTPDGKPQMVKGDEADIILGRLKKISEKLGTSIEIENNEAIIETQNI
ncbi:MAG TPA: CapA family protein [Actinobacteria bacterium]|nr:CapA family protein [Actinomycetota bacterium]